MRTRTTALCLVLIAMAGCGDDSQSPGLVARAGDYEFTVDDPQTYTRPYTVSIPILRSDSDVVLYEYACHEGNIAMLNLLKGGREDEQQALEAAARVSRQRTNAGHPGVREPAVPFAPLP